ncbi:hypothetical protein UPYG_G00130270 [Umbra pygmaea]|uniref:Replication factor A C-terminal domain-containing protein n=1 Tax=Umbra pygmaea TaxID=75934 RepID=A0ABD0XP07_UMBPY
MVFRRVLVNCAVLALQDRHVLYPCCRGCFSRLLQTHTDRWHCSRCGYSCLKQQLEYRYRLSLRVTRDNQIFGLAVFGSCLNHLFGASATQLHRLVEETCVPEGAKDLGSVGHGAALLLKAVEDCFIGRHFVFGIKLSGPPLCGIAPGSQLIANQVFEPLATALGCSVVSYYRTLLHQAAVYPEWSTDPSTDPWPCTTHRTTPLLLPSSPQDSFNSTLPSCGNSRSLHHTYTHTLPWLQSPGVITSYPWLQSPGVITSSAEQESSFEGEGGCRGAGLVPGRKSSSTVSGCLTSPPRTPRQEVGTPNTTFYQDVLSSFCEGPNSLSSVPWAPPTQPDHKRTVPPSYRKRVFSETEEALSEIGTVQHVAWEDVPFSESLAEFVCNPADSDPDTDRVVWRLEPRDIIRTLQRQRFHSRAVKRHSSPGGVEMVPPSTALCSTRSWYPSKGPQSHHTLADRPANQHTCTPDSLSLHLRKKVYDWSNDQEKDVSDSSGNQGNGVCDWSRDMFADSF